MKTRTVRIPESIASRVDRLKQSASSPKASFQAWVETILEDGIEAAEARYIGGKLPKKGTKQ